MRTGAIGDASETSVKESPIETDFAFIHAGLPFGDGSECFDDMSTWFTSDTHFGHAKIIGYCKRPFSSVQQMDEALIERWNARVEDGDVVYHLGDFATGGVEAADRYRMRLNGKIILIRGNHDRRSELFDSVFDEVHELLEVKHLSVDGKSQRITLCHYAMRIWAGSHRGAWHLYGHSHGSLPDDPHSLSLDIGVDCWSFAPVSLQQIQRAMARKRPKEIDHHQFLTLENEVDGD